MATQVGTARGVRAGFTLVELLIVALVVSILATIVIGAYTNAMELGREARTRAQIAKINSLIAGEWEKYRTRRVRLENPTNDVAQNAQNRLDMLRKLMRYEFPDRITDVTGTDVLGDALRPERSKQYRRMAEQAFAKESKDWSNMFQQAECLFLIVATSQDRDTNGLEFFRQTEIGDVDDDDMYELLDGWGNPIEFLRWAPGFVSDKQQAYVEISETSGKPYSVTVRLDKSETANTDPNRLPQWVNANPDPFDPLRVDERGFYLYPLVVSSGPDGISDIRFFVEGSPSYSDPFHGVVTGDSSSSNDAPLGRFQDLGPFSENYTANGKRNDHDNIHNHLISVRMQ